MKRGAPMKRTPMKRGAPLKVTGPARATVKVRKCAVKTCRQPFVPRSMTHKACGPECAEIIGRAKAEKVRLAAERKEAAEHRQKLADSKPLQHWLKLTEGVVNHYIQTRDKGKPCISCGTRRTVQWEAGHFLSVGARPELRYDPRNINLQCHRCNVQLSGNQAAYRIGLLDKIGEAAVEELEGPHPTAHYTRDALAELRRHFAAETRLLKRAAT